MKRISFAIPVLCMVLFGCHQKNESRIYMSNDSCFQVISFNPDYHYTNLRFFNLSEVADTVEYIPLQTNEEITVGEVGKLLIRNGRMYIWDRLSESVFCFDTSGNYLYRVHAQGQGPGEYGRTSDFSLDMNNGHICIFSDVDRAIFEYDENGKFLKETPSPYIITSFAIRGNTIYAYTGRMPNEYPDMDGESQFRFNVVQDGEATLHQLPFRHNEKLHKIPLSDRNFSMYKDTLLLSEDLSPRVYTVNRDGKLTPRYKIDFTTNTYHPSFEDGELDIDRMQREEREGNLTKMSNGFYENDRYVIFNYARGLIGTAYVDKRDSTVHNMGYFNMDDYNHNPLASGIKFVDEEYIYKVEEPGMLVQNGKKQEFSPALARQVAGMSETDNPVIVRIRLK